MSANIPARRTRQAIRPSADENATRMIARTTRSKITAPLGASAPEKPSIRPDLVAAASKRKREALGEVTNKNKMTKLGLEGDGKVAEGKEIMSVKRTELSTVTAARIPLGERRSGNTNLAAGPTRKLRGTVQLENDRTPRENIVEDVKSVEPVRIRASRRISTRTTTTTQPAAGRARAATATVARRLVAGSTRTSKAANPIRAHPFSGRRSPGITQEVAIPSLDDGNDNPAHKKRRTSSVGAEDVIIDGVDRTALRTELRLTSDGPVAEVEKEVEGLGSAEAESRWDDLDKEDASDPLMVSEYVGEIFQYLLKLELLSMPNPRYMDTQAELAWRMRGILTDWLIQIHGRFRLLPETLFLTINIIDRFLSSRVVSLVKLQLVGVTALFIAAKYEEIMAPSVANFLASADGNYNEKDILDAEKYILRTLDWNMSYPNPIHYLRRASKADGYDLAVRTVAKYFIEISCLEHRLLEATPSQVAAAGIWLARLVLDKEEWTPNLAHYSGYSEAAIIPVARIMLNYVLKPTRHDNFFRKYASRKFMKVSPFVYSWARDRWPEGTAVDLEEELLELRRSAKARRDAGQAAGQLAEEQGVLVG